MAISRHPESLNPDRPVNKARFNLETYLKVSNGTFFSDPLLQCAKFWLAPGNLLNRTLTELKQNLGEQALRGIAMELLDRLDCCYKNAPADSTKKFMWVGNHLYEGPYFDLTEVLEAEGTIALFSEVDGRLELLNLLQSDNVKHCARFVSHCNNQSLRIAVHYAAKYSEKESQEILASNASCGNEAT